MLIADTLIAKKTFEILFHGDIELKAEDTDRVCLLVNSLNSENHNYIFVIQRRRVRIPSEK